MADVNYRSYWGEKGLVIYGESLPSPEVNPKAYSDILKFSGCTNSEAKNCYIRGGKENAVDAVRGEDYRVIGCSIDSDGSLGGFTIKGAIKGFLLRNCGFWNHGRKYDIELGQYDDYWYPFRVGTKGVVIDNCKFNDNTPIVVQVWDADKPTVINSNIKVVKIPVFIWFPYFMFKYLKRKIS